MFIHVYPGEKGRFVYQYELRPDNSGWDGAYLFYHDRNGDVKSTNLTRNQTETAEQPAEKAAAETTTPITTPVVTTLVETTAVETGAVI